LTDTTKLNITKKNKKPKQSHEKTAEICNNYNIVIIATNAWV